MFNPLRFTTNLFADKKLTDAKLRAFTEEHLLRLSLAENNPGSIYSGLITATTAKYNTYFGKINNEATTKAIAEGTTISRNQARQAVEEKISQLQGLVKFKFGENSSTYQELFPLGVTEYQRARASNAGMLFDRFATVAATHLNADYPAELSALTALIAAFEAAYIARKTAVAQVDVAGTGKHADRQLLTVQLCINFLTIAANHIGQPERFSNYYNARYLPIADSAETFNGQCPAATIITALPAGHISGSSTVYIENRGSVPLSFSMAETPDTINPASVVTVAPGQQQRYAGQLPVLLHYYLNIHNPHPSLNGSWHVEVSG